MPKVSILLPTYKGKYQIMIGVGTDKIYEVVELLQSEGVDQYCTVYS